jgi:hypothetical protein
MEEYVEMTTSYFATNNLRMGPVEAEQVSEHHYIFTSQTYPLQFELTARYETTNDGEEYLDHFETRVYETPGGTADDIYSGTLSFTTPYATPITYPTGFRRHLRVLTGSMNKAIDRRDLQPYTT